MREGRSLVYLKKCRFEFGREYICALKRERQGVDEWERCVRAFRVDTHSHTKGQDKDTAVVVVGGRSSAFRQKKTEERERDESCKHHEARRRRRRRRRTRRRRRRQDKDTAVVVVGGRLSRI